jgi:predicted nucleotidyltransferase component of viral defense system
LAVGNRVDFEVADQEVVLLYVLALLNEEGLTGSRPDGSAGGLLFKGGTALRKCVFGSTGRFSRDLDFDAMARDGFEGEIDRVFRVRSPYHGIALTVDNSRYSQAGNFGAVCRYRHDFGEGRFELQISYRKVGILDPRPLSLLPQSYFDRIECPIPTLLGLDPYEMIGEKVMACNRRLGGSGKDPYDLFLWAQRPFSRELVRRMAVLKCWTDRAGTFNPSEFLQRLIPSNFRWEDVSPLIPRGLGADPQSICTGVQTRFSFLAGCTSGESRLLHDHVAHRERQLFQSLRDEARTMASALQR